MLVFKSAEVFADRFVIDRLAGSGGMGQVFRATDRLSGETVALKVMAAHASSDRFTREARVLAELRHPGIVRYIAHGTTELGQAYIAMEWLEGETLSARLKRAALSDADSIALTTRVADALSAAHAKAVVHRDVKPGNVMLIDGRADVVKVLDFGIAHLSEATAIMTQSGAVLGTAGYMAPEQARGVRSLDVRADVFALGAILFHCLTGKPPFGGGGAVAILAKLVLDEAPRLRSIRPELPSALDELVARMLSKEPEGRPPDAGAVVRELAAIELAEADKPTFAAEGLGDVLTGTEQRLVSVLLASRVGDIEQSEWGSTAFETIGTVPSTEPSEIPTRAVLDGASGRFVRELRKLAARFGARLEPLRSGSVAVMLSGSTGTGGGSATDLTARAARCALAIRKLLPEQPMALATGRGIVSGAFPVGEVIERAAALLGRVPSGNLGILLDSVTSGLLDTRFEMAGQILLRERPHGDSTRRLLGKPTSTVGRDRELGFLTMMLDECIAEPVARVVLVVGPAGIGKSRVRYEFLRRVLERDEEIQIWNARGDPVGAGSPFGLLAQLIRGTAGIVDGAPPAQSREKLERRIAERVAPSERQRVAVFLGEIARVPFSEGVELEAARRDAGLMGDQMRRAWEDFVLAECDKRPLLLAIEDLHWGDLPTVAYIDALMRVAKDQPLMVVALARPEVRDQFPALWEQRDLQELRLNALTKKAAEKLIREVLGDRADGELVSRLVERADGNAFYLEELIRAVAEGERERLPDTVIAMVQSRLEALPDGARRVLRAASVFGGIFWAGAVAALLGAERDEREVADWLEVLAEREMVTLRPESRFPSTQEFVFRHALVREAAYAMLTPEDREKGHRLAGAWLEKSGEPDAMVLAQHFEDGREPARATAWWRTAAEEAFAAHDLSAAHKAAARARELARLSEAEPRFQAELALLGAEIAYWSGVHGQAAELAELSLEGLEPGSDGFYGALAMLNAARHRHGDIEGEVAIARRVIDEGWADRPGVASLISCTRIATALIQLGDYELADTFFRRLEPWAATVSGDPSAQARWLASLAARALFAGDTWHYRRLSIEAAELTERAGDLRSSVLHRHNAGHGALELGLWEESAAELKQVMRVGERLGLQNVYASAENNLGSALTHLGRYQEAEFLLKDSIDRLRKQTDMRMEGGAHNHLAELYLARGQPRAAVAEAERAVEVLEGVTPTQVHAMGNLARAFSESGDRGRALAAAERAHTLLDEVGSIADGESMVRLVYAECLIANGESERAQEIIERAAERLRERAAAIDDPEARRRFLTSVPSHARLLQLSHES